MPEEVIKPTGTKKITLPNGGKPLGDLAVSKVEAGRGGTGSAHREGNNTVIDFTFKDPAAGKIRNTQEESVVRRGEQPAAEEAEVAEDAPENEEQARLPGEQARAKQSEGPSEEESAHEGDEDEEKQKKKDDSAGEKKQPTTPGSENQNKPSGAAGASGEKPAAEAMAPEAPLGEPAIQQQGAEESGEEPNGEESNEESGEPATAPGTSPTPQNAPQPPAEPQTTAPPGAEPPQQEGAPQPGEQPPAAGQPQAGQAGAPNEQKPNEPPTTPPAEPGTKPGEPGAAEQPKSTEPPLAPPTNPETAPTAPPPSPPLAPPTAANDLQRDRALSQGQARQNQMRGGGGPVGAAPGGKATTPPSGAQAPGAPLQMPQNTSSAAAQNPDANGQPPQAGNPSLRQRVANRMQSQRAKLKRQRESIQRQLDTLENKDPEAKIGRLLRIVRLFLPALYAKVNGAMNAGKNVSGITKIAALEARINALRIARGSIKTAKAGAAIVDAARITLEWALGLIPTFIGTIIVVVLSFFFIPFCAIFIYQTNIGTLTKTLSEIIKELDKMIEPLQKELANETKKVQLRRLITHIDQTLFAGGQAPTPANDNGKSAGKMESSSAQPPEQAAA